MRSQNITGSKVKIVIILFGGGVVFDNVLVLVHLGHLLGVGGVLRVLVLPDADEPTQESHLESFIR